MYKSFSSWLEYREGVLAATDPKQLTKQLSRTAVNAAQNKSNDPNNSVTNVLQKKIDHTMQAVNASADRKDIPDDQKLQSLTTLATAQDNLKGKPTPLDSQQQQTAKIGAMQKKGMKKK